MTDFSIDSNIHGGPITADVTSELTGLDNMKLTLAGGTTTRLAGDNTVHSDATVLLKPVSTTSKVDLGPVTTSSKVDASSSLDLKPVAVDSCVRLELAPPPPTEVCTPYEQRWSWSVLGLELFSLAVSGTTRTHIRAEPSTARSIDL